MKKILLLLAVSAVLLTSCVHEYILEPRADFGVSKKIVYPYEEVKFYNNSVEAYEFEWEFGDGTITNYVDPVHSYSRPGIYNVQLAAYNGRYVDYAYITIEVIEPPSATLDIQVLEYYKQYPIEGASIIIYPTYNDWVNQTNKIAEIITNRDGIAVIDGLEPGNYYLDVWEKNHNNYALADEDVNFIKTPYLLNHTTTYFTAYVDYVSNAPGLKSTTNSRRGNILKTNTHRVYSKEMNIRK